MVDNFVVLDTLRDRLKTLTVVTTGVSSIEALSTGYRRISGSFLGDGFLRGMEVTPINFSFSSPGIIQGVGAETLTIEAGRPPEAVDLRTLVVGLPELRAWENMPFKPQDRRWYIDEDYLPGPVESASLGANHLNSYPSYVIKLYGLAGAGVGALYKVADAILRHFRPNLALPMSDGYILRVRTDVPPSRGQVLPEGSSHALVVITVPLWVQTANIT